MEDDENAQDKELLVNEVDVNVNDDDDDDENDVNDDDDDENDVNEETNKPKDEVLKPLRYFFMFAGQCWFLESKAKQLEYPTLVKNTRKYRAKALYHMVYRLWQTVIACAATAYFVYTFGFWGSKEDAKFLLYYPITSFEKLMWEFRWLVSCLFGIWMTKGIWLELYIDKKISFEDTTRWTKVKYVSWALGGALIFIWTMSNVGSLSEINFNITRGNAWSVTADAVFSLVDRLIAFPLFFLFCITMYALCSMVEEYREKIVEWKRGVNSARERFREIKAAIHMTGLLFEVYIMVHFLLLVCTLFLGVCSCFEQMKVKITDNYTVSVPFQIPHSARYIHFYGYNGTLNTEASGAHPAASVVTASYAFVPFSQGHTAVNGANNTLGVMDRDALLEEYLQQSVKTILVWALVKTFESLLLYLVPVGLMARLQNRLRRVYEVIEDCNVDDQKNQECLFDDVEVIRRMCKYVKTAHGLKIFGYTVPTFESFMLAAFGPFFAFVIQRVLLHTHLE